jgi:hypothetical protein
MNPVAPLGTSTMLKVTECSFPVQPHVDIATGELTVIVAAAVVDILVRLAFAIYTLYALIYVSSRTLSI